MRMPGSVVVQLFWMAVSLRRLICLSVVKRCTCSGAHYVYADHCPLVASYTFDVTAGCNLPQVDIFSILL